MALVFSLQVRAFKSETGQGLFAKLMVHSQQQSCNNLSLRTLRKISPF